MLGYIEFSFYGKHLIFTCLNGERIVNFVIKHSKWKYENFIYFLLEKLTSQNADRSIHRYPQRPILVNKAKKNRSITIKLSTAVERKRIFSSLKRLKKFNEERSASNSPPIYVTEHLPKEFQIQKKASCLSLKGHGN